MAQQQALAVQAGATALELLKSRRADFARVIPKHMNPERLLRIAEGAIRRNPKLMRCTASSLVVGVMEASCLGLEPGVLGDGWLIPYTNSYKGQNGEWQKVEEAQFQPGYQGIEKLAIRSKSVKAINVDVVYQADDFDYGMGSQPFVKHKPSLAADRETGEPICFYCVVDLVSGGQQITIMSNGAVGKIRARSPGKNSPAWREHYDEMGKKTVIKRALKHVPKTPELAKAIEYDDRRETGESIIGLLEQGDGSPLPAESEFPGAPEVKEGPRDSVSAAAEMLGMTPPETPGKATDKEGLDKEYEQQQRGQQREPGSDDD